MELDHIKIVIWQKLDLVVKKVVINEGNANKHSPILYNKFQELKVN
jgi:hypothetical protein